MAAAARALLGELDWLTQGLLALCSLAAVLRDLAPARRCRPAARPLVQRPAPP